MLSLLLHLQYCTRVINNNLKHKFFGLKSNVTPKICGWITNKREFSIHFIIDFFCLGKCQCIDNHCYEDKYCKKDTEECANTTCASGNTCIDLDCVGPAPGTCIRMSMKQFYIWLLFCSCDEYKPPSNSANNNMIKTIY